jgi:subtilisin family serine protease
MLGKFALFVVLAYTAAALAPVRFIEKDGVEDRYIVVLAKNTTDADLASHLAYFRTAHGVSYDYTYSKVLKGFAAKMTKTQLLQVASHAAVNYIEQDQMAHVAQPAPCSQQVLANEVWGLDRICKRGLPLNQRYIYNNQAGAGVDAYIFDTGIYLAHNDFQGRATFGFKAETGWSNTDAHGHGTHVASTVGGIYYGVAKAVDLIAVKVLGDTGSGTYAGIIAGVDYAVTNKASRGKPSVGNMSLQGGYSQPLNDAVDAASSEHNLVMVVAAGNSGANADSCNYSPSGSSFVINVGATTSTDARASFSSVGTCLSVFAPGNLIPAAWIGNPDAENIISGTSMASPHVCGAAALVLGANPSFDFDSVKGRILSLAGQGQINLNCGASAVCQESPNLFLFTNPCGPAQ